MEFIKEEKAFRHYNVAGEIDAEITYIPEGEGVIDANHTFGEWSADELAEMMNNVPAGIENGFSFEALFSDYTIPGTNIAVGYILSAITALLIFYILGKMIRTMNGAKASHA